MISSIITPVHGGMYNDAQVNSLGCKYFALLFDDIDDDLCPEDLSRFSSPAEAQCSITNEIYDYLKQPDVFLFCPTGLLLLSSYLFSKIWNSQSYGHASWLIIISLKPIRVKWIKICAKRTTLFQA